MTNPELGVKRDCPECGARFYDLNKEPAQCPKCAHEFIPEALLKPRKARVADEEEKTEDGEDTAKPEAEVSLDDADEESKEAKSNRKAGLDDDDSDEVAEDELAEFEDVELDDDDTEPDDDTTILQSDDDDDDMAGLVGPTGDDDNDS